MARFDETLRCESGGLVAGIDEAGRGPLAGPVTAGVIGVVAVLTEAKVRPVADQNT